LTRGEKGEKGGGVRVHSGMNYVYVGSKSCPEAGVEESIIDGECSESSRIEWLGRIGFGGLGEGAELEEASGMVLVVELISSPKVNNITVGVLIHDNDGWVLYATSVHAANLAHLISSSYSIVKNHPLSLFRRLFPSFYCTLSKMTCMWCIVLKQDNGI
jgi:hypothetical protein